MRYMLEAELLAFLGLFAYYVALAVRRKLESKVAFRRMMFWLTLFLLTTGFYDPTAPGGFAQVTTWLVVSTGIVVATLVGFWAFFLWWVDQLWRK